MWNTVAARYRSGGRKKSGTASQFASGRVLFLGHVRGRIGGSPHFLLLHDLARRWRRLKPPSGAARATDLAIRGAIYRPWLEWIASPKARIFSIRGINQDQTVADLGPVRSARNPPPVGPDRIHVTGGICDI